MVGHVGQESALNGTQIDRDRKSRGGGGGMRVGAFLK
jgi:hypothetical protein